MTTKDIIEEFQNKYLKSLAGNEELKTQDIIDLLLNIERFLSSSLTELLDSLERSGNNKIYQLITYAKDNREDQDTVSKAHFAAAQLKEVINIINSHR